MTPRHGVVLAALLGVLPATAQARPAVVPTLPPGVEGPLPTGRAPAVVLDLWRARPGADKVHVMARLPDGSEALFLVDTGAGVNVLHREVAERLGLEVRRVPGWVEGLSGAVPWNVARLPTLGLGPLTLRDVDVAVDVPGVPDRAGALPVAGILGTDVLARFTIVVDDGADRLELWLTGTRPRSKHAAPLVLDGGHARTPVTVCARAPAGVSEAPCAEIPMDVDTGARDVLLTGSAAAALREAGTRGVEPVIGIGASLDELPPESFLAVTRRVPIASLGWAGRVRPAPDGMRARWVQPDGPRQARGGLLGWEAWRGEALVLDVPSGRVSVERSASPRRRFDSARAMLARMDAGSDAAPTPDAALRRAQLLQLMGRETDARRALEAAHEAFPAHGEIAADLAWLQRRDGDVAAAVATLQALDPRTLADEGAWAGHIGDLIRLHGVAAARRRAEPAMAGALPEGRAAEQWLVAWSDVLLAEGTPTEAARTLREAVARGGSTHLLRGARLALAEGDHDGAIVALRELMRIYPLDGTAAWLRARVSRPEDVPTLRADLETMETRLHPGDEPLDFLGAAWLAAGDPARAADRLARGRARDCEGERLARGTRSEVRAARRNCRAWYAALGVPPGATDAGSRRILAQALRDVESALRDEPHAAGFLDTASLVAGRLGDARRARDWADAAAARSPADPYLLWQRDAADGRLP